MRLELTRQNQRVWVAALRDACCGIPGPMADRMRDLAGSIRRRKVGPIELHPDDVLLLGEGLAQVVEVCRREGLTMRVAEDVVPVAALEAAAEDLRGAAWAEKERLVRIARDMEDPTPDLFGDLG